MSSATIRVDGYCARPVPPVIEVERGGGDMLEDEVNEVIGGHPVAQIAGQKQWRLPVAVDGSCGHVDRIVPGSVLFKRGSNYFQPPMPDRLPVLFWTKSVC